MYRTINKRGDKILFLFGVYCVRDSMANIDNVLCGKETY